MGATSAAKSEAAPGPGNGQPSSTSQQSNSGFTSQPANSLIDIAYKIFIGVPTDAYQYTAPDGSQFYGPPDANFARAYEAGFLVGYLPLNQQAQAIQALIGQGGIFDNQRSGEYFIPAYTNASNFVVGVVMDAAGYSLPSTIAIAGSFATTMSGQGWTLTQTRWWTEGWVAAATGNLPHGP